MPSNIMVKAGAGTGKTFCVTDGIYRMIGQKRKTVGSEEQQAIWEAMKDPYPGRIHMTSFTTDASEQLAMKGPLDEKGKPLAGCSSTYGMGLHFAKAKGQAGYIDIYKNKYRSFTTEFLGGTKFETNKTDPGLWEAIFELQEKARLNLMLEPNQKQIEDLADWFSVSIPTGKKEDRLRSDIVTEGVNECLKAGREKTGTYDFTDMVYLPLVHDLVRKSYETLIIDESQDMGKAQQEVCLRSSYRRIIIGDPNQAIFGFAGADKDAFGRMGSYLENTQAGVEWFPLSVSRRCCKAVVREANQFVPELKALPDAPEGNVIKTSKGKFISDELPKVLQRYAKFTVSLHEKEPLMIICPTNAPLISVMFGLHKLGAKSYINGGDITKSMVTFVEKFVTKSELLKATEDKLWQIGSKKASKTRETQLDIYGALLELVKVSHDVSAVKRSIDSMFSDKKRPGWIELSSIHKAKGREAETVVVWNIDRCKSPYSKQPWEFQSDRNLEYVADTRAITCLYQIRGNK